MAIVDILDLSAQLGMQHVLTARRGDTFSESLSWECSSIHEGTSAAMWYPILATVSAAAPQSLVKSMTLVSIDGLKAKALIDSGSSESFIHPELVKSAALHIHPSSSTISMVTFSLAMKVTGYCFVNLILDCRTYSNLRLSILPDLCADLILGLDFQSQHETVVFKHGGPKPSLSVCGVSTLNTDSPPPAIC